MRAESMTNQPIVNVFEDEEHMIGALAERIVDMAAACQKRTGRFVAALSGGNTPRPLYEKLATEPQLPCRKAAFAGAVAAVRSAK